MPEVAERKTPWMKFVAFATAVGILTGLVKNFDQIVELFKPTPPTVRIGWMTVSSVASLEKCILKNGSTFEMEKRTYLLAKNDCLSVLNQRIAEAKNPEKIEDVKLARFLLLENSGKPIQRITVEGLQRDKPIDRLRAENNVAICVTIQGKMGGTTIDNPPTKVSIERTGMKTEVIDVPLPSSTLPLGMGTCEAIEFNAPI